MDISTTDSEDEYDGGTISEFEGSDDLMEGGDTLFDPEAISDVESDAGSGDESIEGVCERLKTTTRTMRRSAWAVGSAGQRFVYIRLTGR